MPLNLDPIPSDFDLQIPEHPFPVGTLIEPFFLNNGRLGWMSYACVKYAHVWMVQSEPSPPPRSGQKVGCLICGPGSSLRRNIQMEIFKEFVREPAHVESIDSSIYFLNRQSRPNESLIEALIARRVTYSAWETARRLSGTFNDLDRDTMLLKKK